MATKYIPTLIDLTEFQLNKLHKAIEDKEETVLEISKNQLGKGIEMMLTKTQVNRLKSMKNATRIKFSATQLRKQGQGLLDAIISIGKTLLPVAKNVLLPLGLAGATGAISGLANKAVKGKKGEGLNRAGQGLGRAGTPIEGGKVPIYLSKNEMEDLFTILHHLEDKNILAKKAAINVKNQIKEQKGGFIGTLLASLAAPLLGNLVGGLFGGQQSGSGIKQA